MLKHDNSLQALMLVTACFDRIFSVEYVLRVSDKSIRERMTI